MSIKCICPRRWFVLLVVLLVVLGSFSMILQDGFGQTGEEAKIAEAEDAVAKAFVAIQTAEVKGADMTDLKAQVNVAAQSLEAAEVAYRSGDYQSASQLADQCLSEINGVVDRAVALGNEANSTRANQQDFLVLFASLGLSVLFVCSLFGWRLLKAYYVKRSLHMKPGLVKRD